MSHPFTMKHLMACEKAFDDLEELRYFLECDSKDDVVEAVKKVMEDYEACADMLHILREQINMMDRRAA
jgi:hypothetical protein